MCLMCVSMCSISIHIVFVMSVLPFEGIIALSLQNFIKNSCSRNTSNILNRNSSKHYMLAYHQMEDGGSHIVSAI